MNKFQDKDILGYGLCRDFNVKGLYIPSVKCRVCGEWSWTSGGSYIAQHHVVHFNKAYYIIPFHHPQCLEQFNFNPLAYE